MNGGMHEALELFRARQYPGVVALCSDVLDARPHDLEPRLLLARALLALRRDVEARHTLRRCLRIDARCGAAYRLLGELALRRDELASARLFLGEALRIDPDDADATELIGVVQSLFQPTAVVEKLPAATAAVGCPLEPGSRRADPRSAPDRTVPRRAPRLATGTESELARERGRFGSYLVRVGVLSPPQLSAVLAHHQQTGHRVGSAAVDLGFVSGPKVEWAALAYHSARREP